MGRDCTGALQLLPEDDLPHDFFSIRGEPLTENKVATLLRNAVSDQPLGQREDEADLRLSIAGA